MTKIKQGGAVLFEQARQLDRGLDLHLVEDVRAVHFHRAHADAQLVGHHLVHFAGQDQV